MAEEQGAPRKPLVWWSRQRAAGLSLFIAIAVCIYLCYLIAKPFLPSIAWALALAIATLPLHERMLVRFKNRNVAAALSVTLVAFFITSIMFFVVQQMVEEAIGGVESVRLELEGGRLQRIIENNPSIGSGIRWMDDRLNLEKGLEAAVNWLTSTATSVVTGGAWTLVQLLLTFFFLFYFFRDHEEALETFRGMLPLSGPEADAVFARVTSTIAATVYGTVAVSFVQGTLGGLMFWILGVPAPLLWGLVMALLGLVPVLGAFVVWIPAALLLALEGSWVKALVLTIWGVFVIGLIDNLLYPILVGRRVQMHTLLVFLAIGGGLFFFGPSGLVLGPVILALTLALIEVWQGRSIVRPKV